MLSYLGQGLSYQRFSNIKSSRDLDNYCVLTNRKFPTNKQNNLRGTLTYKIKV